MSASAPSGARYGVTSMVAPLRRVLVRRPATAGDWDGAGWRAPDPALLERQHAAFVELLDGLGVEVEVAGARGPGRRGLHARPADHERPRRHPAADGQARPPARARARGGGTRRLDIPVLGTLDGDAFADGGDRFWLDDTTAAIGLGYRTNRAGARRSRRCPSPRASTSRPTTCPTTRGRNTCSTCSRSCPASTETLYVVYEPLAPVRLLGTCASAASTGSRSTATAT